MARYGGAGFLPYGVDDDSIILRSSLTSESSFTSPEIGTAGNFLVTSGNSIFDTKKGWNPKGNGILRIVTLTDYALLDKAGSVHLEIEREWVCRNDPTNGSYGKVITGNKERAISVLPGTGGADSLIINTKVASASYMGCNLNGMALTPNTFTDWKINTGATITGCYVHSAGKDDFVSIDIGWWGGPEDGVVVLAVDGLIMGASPRSVGSDANIFQNIYLGSDRGVLEFIEDNYIRNLQISTKPPSRVINPKLSKIAILSDSMWEGTQATFGGAYRDSLSIHNLRRRLLQRGFLAGDVYLDVNSGYTIDTTGASDLFDSTNLTALQAERAPIVVIRGGTNDAINDLTIDSSWDSGLKSNLTTILGYESTKAIIMETVPTQMSTGSAYTATREAKVKAMNNYIKALPAWNSKVFVADTFAAVGGENPEDETFIGQLDGGFNNVHFAGLGHKKHAFNVADTIIDNLGSI